jgi:hypothetical protein
MNMRWRTQTRCHHTTPPTIDELLLQTRSGLARLDPVLALHAVHDGAILIDTRPESQRRADGEMPGAIIIERNHLEWRCDPASPARIPEATGHHVKWIICCATGSRWRQIARTSNARTPANKATPTNVPSSGAAPCCGSGTR